MPFHLAVYFFEVNFASYKSTHSINSHEFRPPFLIYSLWVLPDVSLH